ncbi:hypothetical protein FDECE_17746 [Fusarium decemcellulare]|nr:hypothetical protein FDECE_17746 [Fusarium decemcellulare]
MCTLTLSRHSGASPDYLERPGFYNSTPDFIEYFSGLEELIATLDFTAFLIGEASNLYGGGISSFRTWPTDDPSQTIMRLEYYHRSLVETQDFKNFCKFARTVSTEDNDLYEKPQMNLKAGIYREGTLNPNKENGLIRKWNM